ncbi:hypothetical protein lerEdw1_008649 [Lerista edwardsae]|nr:hypothetical protein lerEdw1_008649 [Lerista edwardsae]
MSADLLAAPSQAAPQKPGLCFQRNALRRGTSLGQEAAAGSSTWFSEGHVAGGAPLRTRGMEESSRRRRQPGSNARYRERSYWESRYRDEGAAPAEWFGGLDCFREQLEAELKPGDRILVLGAASLFRAGVVRSDLHKVSSFLLPAVESLSPVLDSGRHLLPLPPQQP